jgi:hypothetical protein
VKRSAILVAVCLLVAASIAISALLRPPVTLEKLGSTVTVHVETLGEYPTTIRHIRLTDTSSRQTVFELLAQGGTPQIYNFRLSLGVNSARIIDPEHGSYRIVAPSDSSTFLVRPGVAYRLEIWGSHWPSRSLILRF